QILLKATGEKIHLHAKRIFLNTGSLPFLPPIEGLDTSQKAFSSTDLLEQSTLPKDIAIVGGGFIGLEFADMYAQFGASVTILERGDTFLPKEDSDVAEEIQQVLTAKGIQILTGVSVEKIEDINQNRVKIYYKN